MVQLSVGANQPGDTSIDYEFRFGDAAPGLKSRTPSAAGGRGRDGAASE